MLTWNTWKTPLSPLHKRILIPIYRMTTKINYEQFDFGSPIRGSLWILSRRRGASHGKIQRSSFSKSNSLKMSPLYKKNFLLRSDFLALINLRSESHFFIFIRFLLSARTNNFGGFFPCKPFFVVKLWC